MESPQRLLVSILLMQQGLNVQYRSAAEEFARRITSSLGSQVDSIVLYGSVARKRARRDSDIDILVIGADSLRDRVLDIAYEVMESSRFQAFVSVFYLSRNEFQELVRLGSSMVLNVLDEGSVLYDDGTFSGIRGSTVAASR